MAEMVIIFMQGRPGSDKLNAWIPLLGCADDGVAQAKQINHAAEDDSFVEVPAPTGNARENIRFERWSGAGALTYIVHGMSTENKTPQRPITEKQTPSMFFDHEMHRKLAVDVIGVSYDAQRYEIFGYGHGKSVGCGVLGWGST